LVIIPNNNSAYSYKVFFQVIFSVRKAAAYLCFGLPFLNNKMLKHCLTYYALLD
jgi:hypothetical protein